MLHTGTYELISV